MTQEDQAKVLAQAIVEIRQLLAGYLGSEATADLDIRQAAHLAYALHNQALAVLDGKSFDIEESISSLKFLDDKLHGDFIESFSKALTRGSK